MDERQPRFAKNTNDVSQKEVPLERYRQPERVCGAVVKPVVIEVIWRIAWRRVNTWPAARTRVGPVKAERDRHIVVDGPDGTIVK